MLKNWWKVLAFLLLLYVIAASFLVKLGPGLIAVDNTSFQPGQNECIIVGYNTHFDAGQAPEVYFAHDSTYMCGAVEEVIAHDRIRVSLDLPERVKSSFFNVYVRNTRDGTTMLPNAIYLEGVELDANAEGYCTPPVGKNLRLAFEIPFQPVIFETIRNLMFHVPMWFTMFFIMLIGFISSIKYLNKPKREFDLRAEAANRVGITFAVLGLITGSIWARFTWGSWWVNDPQLNGALVTFLIYVGYLVLRAGIDDEQKRARVAAVFNIFAYVILFILLMILPRFSEGLHPGKGGNPGFNSYDLDSSLRAIFYPAVLGWILLGYWIYRLRLRMNRLELKLYYDEDA